LANNVNVENLNQMVKGFSGADIETFCREAAMIALRENIRARKVSEDHFKEARKIVDSSVTQEIIEWYSQFGTRLKRRRIEESKEDRLFV